MGRAHLSRGANRPRPRPWRLPHLLGLGAVAAICVVGRPPAAASPPAADSLFHGSSTFDPDQHPGKALYLARCAACHEGAVPKAPHREFLETLAPQAIIAALTTGVMRDEAKPLSANERTAVAEYLVRSDLSHFRPAPGAVPCHGAARHFDLGEPPAEAGWGYDPRRFVPEAAGGVDRSNVARLKLKWAFAFPNTVRARSQPVVAMGALFVGSQDGTVYAFDLASGCARWTHNVGAEVRTAVVVTPWASGTRPSHPRAFFGDLLGRIYALDALTGRQIWRQSVADHPNATVTGTPLLRGTTLYVPVSSLEVTTAVNPAYACCTFRGSLVALDTTTGRIEWRHYSVQQSAVPQGRTTAGTAILGPSGGGVWTSPTFDPARNVVYHGSGQNYSPPADGNSDAVFAVDARTGARRWQQQFTSGDIWTPACIMKSPNCVAANGRDYDIGASVLLIDLAPGRQILVAGQKSGLVYGLDPDAGGKLVWQQRVGRGSIMGGVHFGMAAEGTRVYVPIDDNNILGDGTMPTEPGFPGVHALDAATGEILWRSTPPNRVGVSAALTAVPGIVFAAYLDGMLRAQDGATGEVLWESNTVTPVRAVNGPMTRGGSISGPGVAVAHGYVIINSGYAYAMHEPGNALLVYGIDGQ